MERSANAYPWSYNEEEDGGERTEDWTDVLLSSLCNSWHLNAFTGV